MTCAMSLDLGCSKGIMEWKCYLGIDLVKEQSDIPARCDRFKLGVSEYST